MSSKSAAPGGVEFGADIWDLLKRESKEEKSILRAERVKLGKKYTVGRRGVFSCDDLVRTMHAVSSRLVAETGEKPSRSELRSKAAVILGVSDGGVEQALIRRCPDAKILYKALSRRNFSRDTTTARRSSSEARIKNLFPCDMLEVELRASDRHSIKTLAESISKKLGKVYGVGSVREAFRERCKHLKPLFKSSQGYRSDLGASWARPMLDENPRAVTKHMPRWIRRR